MHTPIVRFRARSIYLPISGRREAAQIDGSVREGRAGVLECAAPECKLELHTDAAACDDLPMPPPFSISQLSSLSRADAREWALGTVGTGLSYARYFLESSSKQEVVFRRSYRPVVTWFIVVLAFPLGLLALLIPKRAFDITVAFEKDGSGGTYVTIRGQARSAVVKGLQIYLDDLRLDLADALDR